MSLKISRILHAGYIFTKDQTNIVFDPIFENPFSFNCYAFPEVEFDLESLKKLKFDAVFISHYHDDHFSLESLNFFDRMTPIFIYCIHEELISLLKDFGFSNVIQLEINQTVVIDKFRVTPRLALDPDVDSLFQIQVDDLNILNVVDSWIDPYTLNQLEKMKPWHLVLWPFQTMLEFGVLAPDRYKNVDYEWPCEWIEQLTRLQPQSIVPSSCQFKMEKWSWYNEFYFPMSYKKFKTQINQALPLAQIIQMSPSDVFAWQNKKFEKVDSIPWVQLKGDQTEDYVFNPHIEPMSTAQISQKLDDINFDQKEKVLRFCTNNLPKIFNQLNQSQDPYFHNKLYWLLNLWDKSGHSYEFYYLLENQKLSNLSTRPNEISWTTEIPIQKLFSAIENGEALNSLYIRINNSQFDSLIEDPLIRTLYHDNVGSYQKAQLRKLSQK